LIKTAIILAGGFGTRLSAVIGGVPKPLAPVNGLPFLNYQLSYLKHYGIERVIISTGYLAEKITSFYGSEFKGMAISYSHEEEPLGTGGGVRLAIEGCAEEQVFVMNGDSFFDVDLSVFYQLHSHGEAQISLALRQVANASRYGTIGLGHQNRITSFKEKSEGGKPGVINGGLYLLDRRLYLGHTPGKTNFSIEKDFFERQLDKLCIKGFEFDAYFIDIGVPEDYARAQDEFKRFKY
jgi:D-glycero-alpha-D-manno-heptose 1-phosphate guanylyltransferase